MFSGIVEDVGDVVRMERTESMPLWDGSLGEGWTLEVSSPLALDGAYLGCSIAVNGVCLTATALDATEHTATFGVAPETLRCSNLGALEAGGKVHLERALPAGSRNSGHFVQGHVDARGRIIKAWSEGDSLWLKIGMPGELCRYVVPKGFVAVDGTSLTVVEVASPAEAGDRRAEGEPAQGEGTVAQRDLPKDWGWFTLMLVAYTQTKVLLPQKALEGERDADADVNLEVDVLAKYVERGLQGILSRMDGLEEQLKAAQQQP